jgi:trehalose 6-phosphate phosphatase
VLDADATVAALSERPAETVVLLDFDGSISPIVATPDLAVPLPDAPAVLEALVARLGRVAVVSGRPVAFLAEHLPVRGLQFVGLYGIERLVDGVRSVDPRVIPYLDAVAVATAEAESGLPGVLVEPKSGVAVTLHWRTTPERAEEVRAFAHDLAARHGLEELPGRSAIELRPPVPVDKGHAAAALVDGFAVGAFAGDDLGDVAAFDALAAAAAGGRLERAVRIGVDSPEAPAALHASVDVLVDGPEGLLRLFRRVIEEIGEPV